MDIGTLAAVISIMAFLVGVGIWIGRRQSFEKTTGKAIDRIDTSVEKINDSIGSIKVNVAVLASGKSVDTTASPLRLTEFGKSIYDAVGGKNWARAEANLYTDQFGGKQPYDVQKFAFGHVYEFQPSEEMSAKMKDYAYENGIAIDLVLRVLAIDLRDAMLDNLGMDPPENGPAS